MLLLSGTLSFTRNGKDLGVAVEGLAGEMYPAFSLYNQDDQLSIMSGGRVKVCSGIRNSRSSSGLTGGFSTLQDDIIESSLSRTQSEGGGLGRTGVVGSGGGIVHSSGSGARRKLHRLNKSLRLLNLLSTNTSSTSSFISLPSEVSISDLEHFQAIWKEGGMCRVSTSDGNIVVLNATKCTDFGYKHGDVFHTTKGDAYVVGVAHNMLYTRNFSEEEFDKRIEIGGKSLSKGEPNSKNSSKSNKTDSSKKNNVSNSGSTTTSSILSLDVTGGIAASNKSFSSSISYTVTPWTRKAVREVRGTTPPTSLNINSKNIPTKNNNNNRETKSSSPPTSTTSTTSSSLSSNNSSQWWSNDNAQDDIILNVLNDLTMWNGLNSHRNNGKKILSYHGCQPWNVSESDVRSELTQRGISNPISQHTMLRVLSIVYTNHLLEAVLPFVETWRDGTSLSAAGWTPIASNSAAIGGWCPQPWSFGAQLVHSKNVIMAATKYRLLCMLMRKTCTMNVGADSKKKSSKITEKSTIEVIQASTKNSTNRGNGNRGNGGNCANVTTFFSQCCTILPSLPTASLRYGDGTINMYCIRVRFRSSNTGGGNGDNSSVGAHFSSIQGQDHLHDWTKYQKELFQHVANDINEERTTIFVRGYSTGKSTAPLIPAILSYDKINLNITYKCVGWLIGIALRTRTSFSIDLAPFMWKLLIDPTIQLTVNDLIPLDHNGAIEYIESNSDKDIIQNIFCENVPKDTRKRVLDVRLNRSKKVMLNIRSGLLDIIPGHSLAMFTWKEFKSIVAGRKD